jgi:hypothetical protein
MARGYNGSYSNDTASPEQNLLPQEACSELHQPANASLAEYGYGWITTTRAWASHTGSNTLNIYTVWLGFDIDRAFVGFTNGAGRFEDDLAMAEAALRAAIDGKEDCLNRIPSDAYSTSLQNFTGSSASGIHSMAALYGGIFVGMMLLLL